MNRQFHPEAPRRLWVADVTYVRTWAGFAYVAFVTDAYSRRIVGWNVASTLKADVLPLQALNMAAWDAEGQLDQLTHHWDHGSNYMALVYTDRIVELGATPSTGTVGDSFDNALAEAVNGLYKNERFSSHQVGTKPRANQTEHLVERRAGLFSFGEGLAGERGKESIAEASIDVANLDGGDSRKDECPNGVFMCFYGALAPTCADAL